MRRLISCLALLTCAAPVLVPQVTFHARIKVEDGSPLPSAPLVQVGRNKDLLQHCRVLNVFGDGTVSYWVDPSLVPQSEDFAWTEDSCRVTIRLKGFQRLDVLLRNNSTVYLRREGEPRTSTVSIGSVNVPTAARRAYERGISSLGKRKLPAAAKEFERAVELYPAYAQAWSELAVVRERQGDRSRAKEAAARAIKADASYIRAYAQSARLAIDDGLYEEALALTGRALSLKAGEVPEIYFYNAVANYNLKSYEAAEKSARRAIELDLNRQIPMAEQVLGSTLAAEGDTEGAIEHLAKYLEISPLALDVEKVKRAIATLQRR